MLMDNQAAIAIFKTGATHSRTKHYAARIALVHDLTKSYMLKVGYIPTDEKHCRCTNKGNREHQNIVFRWSTPRQQAGVSAYITSQRSGAYWRSLMPTYSALL